MCCVLEWMRSDDSVPNWCVVRGRKATSIRVVLVVRRAIQVATTKCYPTTGATSWSCPRWRFVRVKMDRSQSTGNADQSAAPPTRTNSSVSCNTTTSGTGTGKDGELVRSDWAAFLILGGCYIHEIEHIECAIISVLGQHHRISIDTEWLFVVVVFYIFYVCYGNYLFYFYTIYIYVHFWIGSFLYNVDSYLTVTQPTKVFVNMNHHAGHTTHIILKNTTHTHFVCIHQFSIFSMGTKTNSLPVAVTQWLDKWCATRFTCVFQPTYICIVERADNDKQIKEMLAYHQNNQNNDPDCYQFNVSTKKTIHKKLKLVSLSPPKPAAWCVCVVT